MDPPRTTNAPREATDSLDQAASTVDRADLVRFGLERSVVVESVGEVQFADPFRHLEDESPRVLAWQAHMNAEAETVLDTDRVAALSAAIAVHLSADAVAPPAPAGGRWFWRDRDDSGRFHRVRVSRRLQEPGEVVVRADEIPLGGGESIDWCVPSPDGRLVALAVSSHGDEQGFLCLFDVEGGVFVEPRVRHVGDSPAVWLPDSSGLYCYAGRGPDHEKPVKRIVFIRPGEGAAVLDGPAGVERYRPVIQMSPDGRHLGLAGWGHFPRLVFVYDRVAGSWHQALPDEPDGQTFFGVFTRGEYYAVTTYGAPRGRLVAAPVDAIAGRAAWREIVPEGPSVLRSVATAGADLVLLELVEGAPRLRLVSTAGEPRGAVPLPDELVISATDRDRPHIPTQMPASAADGEIVFAASSVKRSPTLWRYEIGPGRLTEVTRPAVELPSLAVRRVHASADGAHEVAYDLTAPAEPLEAGPRPTLIYAYGGFNAAWMTRGYPSLFAPWVNAGGNYVFAHLPGDGTFGVSQWHGGRREAKQRTFDDLFAVAEDLVERGLTTPDQLAIAGGSNGGLLASAAINQRPELFRAAAVLVPVADLARFVRERFGEACILEYGDPREPEAASWIRPYSPYHNVVAGQRYPATVVVCGDRDMRTPAWHGRKLVAALMEANAGEAPILLRVHEDCGHLTAGVAGHPKRIAEWLGFLMDAVGLE